MFRPPTGRWYREARRYRDIGRYRRHRRYRRRRGMGGLIRRILAILLVGRIVQILIRKDRQRFDYD